MNVPRLPLLYVTAIIICLLIAAFNALFIWALLYLEKPVGVGDVGRVIFSFALLAWACLDFDRYTFKREHLQAERKLTQAYRALQVCAELVHYRIDRGIRVYGTPLHTSALVRKRRALDALRAAQWFRDRA